MENDQHGERSLANLVPSYLPPFVHVDLPQRLLGSVEGAVPTGVGRSTAEEQRLGGDPVGRIAALEAEVTRLRAAEQSLLESNDALRLLSETASELMSSDQPQVVIASLFQKLSARLGLEAYFNYLVDEEKGKLHLNSYAGIPAEVAREIEWLAFGQAVCGCVAQDGCRMVAEDIQHSKDIRANLVRSFGITAYACHPLIARGKVIGTFSFGTSRKPYFEPHELALMQAVCDQVSMSMERILLISQLQRAVLARDEFLSVAAHELKTPLTSLRGFAQTVVRQIEKGQQVDPVRLHRTFQVVDQQSEKLAYLVSRLLDVSRIEAGRLVLEKRRVDIGQLARTVVEELRITFPHQDIALQVHEPIWVMADPTRLEQVLRNLLDNAVKFGREGECIDVDVWSPEIGSVNVAVRDRGIGIPLEHRGRLFDRFHQAHSAEHTRGMGLGLYISHQIMRLHDGTIDAEFPEDGGSRFVISLPTVLAEVERQREAGKLGK